MGKRKSKSRAQEQDSGPNLDVGESRKRIRDYEDVADSDDDFHLQRDKVLLGEEPATKRRRKWQEQEDFLEPSDEEVLDYEDEDEDEVEVEASGVPQDGQNGQESDDAQDGSEGDNGDDGLAWGTSKADLYGADEIETEEQALEEEQEALRLQKKQLQAMSAADYGFEESDWQDGGNEAAEAPEEVVTEQLPQLQVTEDMSPAERLKLLKNRYPEFDPLSKELLDLREVHAQLLTVAGTIPPTSDAITKLRAVSAYLGTLTMYFALLTSPASTGQTSSVALSATRLRDHPVMESLVQCRALWQRAQNLPADDVLDDDEDAAGIGDLDDVAAEPEILPPVSKKSRAQRHADAAQEAAEAKKVTRLAKTEAGLADLDDLLALAASRKKVKQAPTDVANGADSDIGEEVPLTAREAADKAKRKKSLRFYTSQIAQKANKRGASGRDAGGDEDVPYRERLKDRQARLNAEAEKRGTKRVDVGADLGGESDEEDVRQAREIRAEANEDDYYDMIAARASKKKFDKAALAEAQKQAALTGGRVIEQETVGADGKRKISYAIEKNKGLTPHRKKDVRNPRVKKRKKYDEKKKKLASMKPTYKGGEGRGGYGGELTGIKKGLVKSTKL